MWTIENRQDILNKTEPQLFDVIVIGGGITGAGIALDAASRGMSVLLLEKKDFASGTSSKSTKLIHGGLRYLKQLEIGLVRDTGLERAVLHRLAPHLVKPEKMLLPIIKNGTYGKFASSLGLWVYDMLARVSKNDRRKMLDKEQTLQKEPLIDQEIVEGGGLYAEYRTDDARLTVEVIKTATRYGACCLNYFEVTDFYKPEKNVEGVIGIDHLTGRQVTYKSKYVVSAAGPWVDTFKSDTSILNNKSLRLTKGVHIVVSYEKLPLQQSVYFDVPDGRMIFAIPRGKVTYIGTTDTDYDGDLNDVKTSKEDVDYLIYAVNAYFPSIRLSIENVESSWAGLRPLIHEGGKKPSEVSRKDELFRAKDGLITIAGGKLTGYRKMAKKVIDLVATLDKASDRVACQSKSIPLTKEVFADTEEVNQYILKVQNILSELEEAGYMSNYLVSNYGRQTEEILQTYLSNNTSHSPEEKLLLSELQFCVENEMVAFSNDFFVRRTGRMFFDIDSVVKYKDIVNQYLGKVFSWSSAKQEEDLNQVNGQIDRAKVFVDVSSSTMTEFELL